MRAPVLIPVTTSNCGRVPDSVQPLSNPAENAPFIAPLDSTSTSFGLSTAMLPADKTSPSALRRGDSADPASSNRDRGGKFGAGNSRMATQPLNNVAKTSIITLQHRGREAPTFNGSCGVFERG